MTKEAIVEEIKCWVTAIVGVTIAMSLAAYLLINHRKDASEGIHNAKESALDAAAKASVSFEERRDKFRNDSTHE